MPGDLVKLIIFKNNTACWLHAFVPDYTRVTLESYVTYTDGSHSDIGKYATDFAPTSFILPETIFKTYNVPLGMRGRLANNSQVALLSHNTSRLTHKNISLFCACLCLTFLTIVSLWLLLKSNISHWMTYRSFSDLSAYLNRHPLSMVKMIPLCLVMLTTFFDHMYTVLSLSV